jgi:hypothetical protein
MATGRTVQIYIEGHPGNGSPTLTTPLPDGSGYACLYGLGAGPHTIGFAVDPDGTMTLTGRSGKLTTRVVVTPEAELS